MTQRDECDMGKCSARALVFYVKGSEMLAFCGHHSDEMWPALTGLHWQIARDVRIEVAR